MSDETTTAEAKQELVQKADLGQLLMTLMEFKLTPEKIARKLKKSVVGQDLAVERTAVILRHHMLRLHSMFLNGKYAVPMPRHTILLIGPTGCGKTYLAHALAAISGLPFHVEDCTMLTETGYVGRDIGDVVNSLVQNAAGILEAEHSVLLLDEIDKLAATPARTRDISGGGAQDLLLQLLSRGNCCEIPRGSNKEPSLPFSPKKLLIIAAGAFSGLSDIVEARVKGKRRIGLSSETAPKQHAQDSPIVTEEDLIAYGLKPELVGRFSEIIVMGELGPEHLSRILQLPDGPIAAYASIAKLEGFGLHFEPDLLETIARDASESGLGARSLGAVVSRLTHRAFFELPGKLPRRMASPEVVFTSASLADGSYTVRSAEV